MICKFCGNSIEDNSDFCFICGQKVDPQEAPAVSKDIFSQAAAAPAAPAAPAPTYDPAYIPVAPAQEPVYDQETVEPAPICASAYLQLPEQTGITDEEFKGFKKQYKSDKKAYKKAMKAAKKAAKQAAKEAAAAQGVSYISNGFKIITAIIPLALIVLAAFLQNMVSFACVAVYVFYAIFEKSAYDKATQLGDNGKAEAIANSAAIGTIVGLVIACFKLFYAGFIA